MSAGADTGIRVVRFSGVHQEQVVRLILTIQQKEFGLPIRVEDQPDLLAIPEYYRKGCGNFWVAEHASRVVGSIALLDIGNHEGAVRKLFVEKRFRGSELGAARTLLQEMLSWSRRKELKRLYLGTTSLFLAAHAFYEKNGFQRIEKSALPRSFPIMDVDTRFYTYAIR